MAKIDVPEVKRKILSFIEQTGPSIPNQIAKKIDMQPMFTSAILSELLHEKKLKTSSMKIGSSPLYLIHGQEQMIENFTDNLVGVEKEAYLKLKDNKLLEDELQEPKIRVALRGLKDFAIPMQINNKTYWKYFTTSTEKIKESLRDEGEVAMGERIIGQKIWEDVKKDIEKHPEEKIEIKDKSIKEEVEEKKIENIFENKGEIKKEKTKPLRIKKISEKDIFLDQAKKILHAKNIDLLEVLQYDKKQVIAKVRINIDKNCLLLFIDKKRPDDKDLLKIYKKSQEYSLPYYIITESKPSKKMEETAKMYKSLIGFDTIEEQ